MTNVGDRLRNVFAYGTLMEEDRLQSMIGRVPYMIPAVLTDYVRLEPAYFMCFPHQGAETRGLILLDVTDSEIERMDRYEGHGLGYYERKTLWVVRLDSDAGFEGFVRVECYVGGPHMQWYYADWRDNQLQWAK